MIRAAVVLFFLSLNACGLKGDLFLPPEPEPIQQPPSQEVNPPAEIEGEDEVREAEPAAP
ncbi:MAG: LPS translocon maturation chaperone LptM [Gammaproteobacteria bacterium]